MEVQFAVLVIFCYCTINSLVSAQVEKYNDEADADFDIHRFSGPDLEEIVFPDASNYDPLTQSDDYPFLGLADEDESGKSQTHQETRNGDKVSGEYRVMQPDGMVRVVRYTADPKKGFKATVDYSVA